MLNQIRFNGYVSRNWALQIDHVNGDGYIKRKSIKSYEAQLKDIKEHKEEYQVLCANCNWIKKYENKEEHYANQNKLKG